MMKSVEVSTPLSVDNQQNVTQQRDVRSSGSTPSSREEELAKWFEKNGKTKSNNNITNHRKPLATVSNHRPMTLTKRRDTLIPPLRRSTLSQTTTPRSMTVDLVECRTGSSQRSTTTISPLSMNGWTPTNENEQNTATPSSLEEDLPHLEEALQVFQREAEFDWRKEILSPEPPPRRRPECQPLLLPIPSLRHENNTTTSTNRTSPTETNNRPTCDQTPISAASDCSSLMDNHYNNCNDDDDLLPSHERPKLLMPLPSLREEEETVRYKDRNYLRRRESTLLLPIPSLREELAIEPLDKVDQPDLSRIEEDDDEDQGFLDCRERHDDGSSLTCQDEDVIKSESKPPEMGSPKEVPRDDSEESTTDCAIPREQIKWKEQTVLTTIREIPQAVIEELHQQVNTLLVETKQLRDQNYQLRRNYEDRVTPFRDLFDEVSNVTVFLVPQ